MSEHRISTIWQRNGGPFERGNYSKDHQSAFEGGQSLSVSSAAAYGGNEANADPEQLLVAALSSCHMLTFLALVANRGVIVDEYHDDAIGVLEKNADGQMVVTSIALRPKASFSGDNIPDAATLAQYHERAHKACFIANSIKCEVTVEAQ